MWSLHIFFQKVSSDSLVLSSVCIYFCFLISFTLNQNILLIVIIRHVNYCCFIFFWLRFIPLIVCCSFLLLERVVGNSVDKGCTFNLQFLSLDSSTEEEEAPMDKNGGGNIKGTCIFFCLNFACFLPQAHSFLENVVRMHNPFVQMDCRFYLFSCVYVWVINK